MTDVSANDANNGSSRVTTGQRAVMLDFMQSHPALAMGRFIAPDGAKHKARLLVEMAKKLNSVPRGCTKSSYRWYKCWQDWKSDVKKKALKLKLQPVATGGGQPCKAQLTELEEHLIALLGCNRSTCNNEGPPVSHVVKDPLDAQLSQDAFVAVSVTDVPAEPWVEAVFVPPVEATPQHLSQPTKPDPEAVEKEEPSQPTACTFRVPLPHSPHSPHSPSESSSSDSGRTIRRPSYRSQIRHLRNQSFTSTMESSEAKVKQVQLQERSIELQEESLRF